MSTEFPAMNASRTRQHQHEPHVGSSVAIPRDLQCGYRSKVCNNVRATKLDGTLHKLCEFHRLKANSSQRRLQKRRQMRKLEEAAKGKHARDSDSEESASSVDGPTSHPAKRARTDAVSSPTTTDDVGLLVGSFMASESLPGDATDLNQTLLLPSSTFSYAGESHTRVPAQLGMFDIDMATTDVLREFTGQVTMPATDLPSAWCWTV